MSPQLILTLNEVAGLMRLSPSMLKKRLAKGVDHPPWFPDGKRRMFRRVEVEEWLNNRITYRAARTS